MSIRSIKDVTDFLQKNEGLIKEIQGADDAPGTLVTSLAERLEANRKASETLLEELNTIEFAVAVEPDKKQKQAALLNEIGKVSTKIQKFKNAPNRTTRLYLKRSNLYLELGNTYNDLVGQFVTFTQDEVDEFRDLLRQAALDIQERQQVASLLNGALNISKFALGIATKLV